MLAHVVGRLDVEGERVTTPSAPSPTTVPSKSGSPRATDELAAGPDELEPRHGVARSPFVSPDPCVDVATAPATEMCGSEARLASASPRRGALGELAVAQRPLNATVPASRSTDDVRG